MTKNGGIGITKTLSETGKSVPTMAWKVPEELKLFREKTRDGILIMGRTTIESLPVLGHNRTILGLTRQTTPPSTANEVRWFSCLEQAYNYARETWPGRTIWIGGGANLYKQVLSDPWRKKVERVHLSIMTEEYPCDISINIDWSSWVYIEPPRHNTHFSHSILYHSPGDEQDYLQVLEDVLLKGQPKIGRNGKTQSLFFKTMSFDLNHGFPLLTTKKMFLRGVIEELLFFLRGDTDSTILEKKGVRIWQGNTNREFLTNNGFPNRKPGLMGPLYGFQWRFYGAEYDEETGQPKPGQEGKDQLAELIENIRRDPHSRRLLMTDYNPSQAQQGVLFPCHSLILQCYVRDLYLDMSVYNRSQDVFLGVPFNIASSALLLILLSKMTGYHPGHLHMCMGDVHLYEQHLNAAREQLARTRYALPRLHVNKALHNIKDLTELKYEDFQLDHYLCHPAIHAEMIA